VITAAAGRLVVVSSAHAYFNVNWASILNDYVPAEYEPGTATAQ
jgi:hypothetical protein